MIYIICCWHKFFCNLQTEFHCLPKWAKNCVSYSWLRCRLPNAIAISSKNYRQWIGVLGYFSRDYCQWNLSKMLKLLCDCVVLCDCVWWLNGKWKHKTESTQIFMWFGLKTYVHSEKVLDDYILDKHLCYNKLIVGCIY